MVGCAVLAGVDGGKGSWATREGLERLYRTNISAISFSNILQSGWWVSWVVVNRVP